MVSKTEAKELAPLADYVNEMYGGNLLSLTKWLDRAVYLFHFIPEEENFSSKDKHNVVGAIMALKERLLEVYCKQRGIHFTRMD